MGISFDELQKIDKTLERVNNILRKRYDNHVFRTKAHYGFGGIIREGETLSLYKPRVEMLYLKKDGSQYVFRPVVIFNQCQSENLWFLHSTWLIRKPFEASFKQKLGEIYNAVNGLIINLTFIQHVLYKHFLEDSWVNNCRCSTLGCSPQEFFNSFGSPDYKSIPLSSVLEGGLMGIIDTTIFNEYWEPPVSVNTQSSTSLQNVFVYNGLRNCYSLGASVEFNSTSKAMTKCQVSQAQHIRDY